jgi:hypothetical protein
MRVRDLKVVLDSYQKIEMYYVQEENAQYYLGLAKDIPVELLNLNILYMFAGSGDCPKYQHTHNVLCMDAYDDAALKKVKEN